MNLEILNLYKIEYGWIKVYYKSVEKIQLAKCDDIELLFGNSSKVKAKVILLGDDKDGEYLILYLYSGNHELIVNGIIDIKLIFSPIHYIANANEVIELFDYWPSFHDDEIIEFIDMDNSIQIRIRMSTKPENVKDSIYITFSFTEIICKRVDFSEAYGDILSIILDLDFSINHDRIICCDLYSSLGISGVIESRRISVQVERFHNVS